MFPHDEEAKRDWERRTWIVTDCCNEIVLPEVAREFIERDLESESPFKMKNQPEMLPMCPNPDKAKCIRIFSKRNLLMAFPD